MRKFGKILLIFGSLAFVLNLIGLLKDNTSDPSGVIFTLILAIVGLCLLFIGNKKKKKVQEKGENYSEIGWGKVIGITFGILVALGGVANVLYKIIVEPQTFTYYVQNMNKSCPMHIDGIGTVDRVGIEDSLVVIHCQYDSENELAEIAKANPEKATRMTILSILLNAKSSQGQSQIVDKMIDNNYGLKLAMLFLSPGELGVTTKDVVATCSELKELRQLVSNNPSQAYKEVVEWQIEMNKSELPVEIDESITLIDISCKDNNIVYKFEIGDDTPVSDFDDSQIRKDILNTLCQDPVSRVDIEKWIVANFGLIYKYVNKEHTDSLDQMFSVSEIKEAFNQPI